MIYDGFIFFNELELLDIRLHELNNLVDRFVLVESTQSFSGQNKPLYFEENKSQFRPYLEKIIHVVVDFPETVKTPWEKEYTQRRAISRGLEHCNLNDIVIFSDVDEIPSSNALSRYRIEEGAKMFEQIFCYYYVNCVATKEKWYGSRLSSYAYFLRFGKDVQNFRWRKLPIIPKGGWHFSYLGGKERIKEKISAFAHQELNIPEFTNDQWLEHVLSSHQDLFKRKIDWQLVSMDQNLPAYFLENIEKFTHLIAPNK